MQALVVLSIHIFSLQVVHLGHIYPQNIFFCRSILQQQKHYQSCCNLCEKSHTFTNLTHYTGMSFSGKVLSLS